MVMHTVLLAHATGQAPCRSLDVHMRAPTHSQHLYTCGKKEFYIRAKQRFATGGCVSALSETRQPD